MGLDMHLFTRDPTEVGDQVVNIPRPPYGQRADAEIYYWRSNWTLHRAMGRLYHAKGGTLDFNGLTVRLDLADLAALERWFAAGSPETGDDVLPFEDRETTTDPSDADFLRAARAALAAGLVVVYSGDY